MTGNAKASDRVSASTGTILKIREGRRGAESADRKLLAAERVPVSNDIPSWGATPARSSGNHAVFTGLTMLDAGTVGAVSLIPGALTPHEEGGVDQHHVCRSVHARATADLLTLCVPPRSTTPSAESGGKSQSAAQGRRSCCSTAAASRSS